MSSSDVMDQGNPESKSHRGVKHRVEGLLECRSSVVKSWHVRYFILESREARLYYFKKRKTPFLTSNAAAKYDIALGFIVETPPTLDGYYGLQIETRNGEQLWLRAVSRQEISEWLTALRTVRNLAASLARSRLPPTASSARTLGGPEELPSIGGSSEVPPPVDTGRMFSSSASLAPDRSDANATSSLRGAVMSSHTDSRELFDCSEGGGETKTYTAADFDGISVLGKGAFARVILVRKRDSGTVFALKVIRKVRLRKQKQIDHTLAEKQLLERISHPFIVKLRMAFQSPTRLFLLLEYVNGGELFYHQQRQGRFTFERTRLYLAETVLALRYLHEQCVIYRDLKLENLLLDAEGHLKLSDFGLIKQLSPEVRTTSTFCGTPEYLAPEVIEGKAYSYPIDWWALGVVAFEMSTGKAPFEAERHTELYDRIRRADVRLPPDTEPRMAAFIAQLLHRDPAERLGVRIFEVYNHPVFEGQDWADVLAKRIVPAFQPFLLSEIDASNFDPEFTRSDIASFTGSTSHAEATAAAATAAMSSAGLNGGLASSASAVTQPSVSMLAPPDFGSFSFFPRRRSEYERRELDVRQSATVLDSLFDGSFDAVYDCGPPPVPR